MRVLFSTYPVAFDCPGGGEIQLHKCRQALEALGIEVLLFDPWRPQFDRADLVHYFSVQGGSMNFCDYVKRIGLPLLISPVLWLTAENRPLMPLCEIRDLLHRADRILPNSVSEREQLADEFGLDRAKFSVIPNGVEPRFGVPADPQAFRRHFGVSSPFLLNVANIEPRKNQHTLARVARELDFDLLLLGRVRDADYLATCLAAGGRRVCHLGSLDHSDPLLAAGYRACEVFVLPSRLETPGLAALEAAAQGARLVVTRVGSTCDYFGPLAGYVDPDDPAGMARAIEAARHEPADGRLREHVLSNFTWEQAGLALIDAYHQTLLAASAA